MLLAGLENHLQWLQALTWTLNHHCHHQLKKSIWTKKICRISFYRSERLWELPDWHQCGHFHSYFDNQMNDNDRPKVYCSAVSNFCKNLFQSKSKHRHLQEWHQPHSSRSEENTSLYTHAQLCWQLRSWEKKKKWCTGSCFHDLTGHSLLARLGLNELTLHHHSLLLISLQREPTSPANLDNISLCC